MPLSIALPSTKPAAEVPVGEGIDQVMNYTWFENAEISESTTLRQLSNSIITANLIEASDHSCIKIPNPLNRPLKTGSQICIDTTDELALCVSTKYGIYLIGADGHVPLKHDMYYDVDCYTMTGHAVFIVGEEYIVPSVGIYVIDFTNRGLNDSSDVSNVSLKFVVTSDKDYIYLRFYEKGGTGHEGYLDSFDHNALSSYSEVYYGLRFQRGQLSRSYYEHNPNFKGKVSMYGRLIF